MSNLPKPYTSPQSPRKRSPQRDSDNSGNQQSTLPVPKLALTPSQTSAALSRFQEENTPPNGSVSGLGARARDSLLLPNTRNLPKKPRPSGVQRTDTYSSIQGPSSFIQEAASTSKLPRPTLSPIAEPQSQNTFHEFPTPLSTTLSTLPQQQPQTPIAQQQEDELADLPASKLPTSATSKLPRQTFASKAKNVFRDIPTSKLPKSKASPSKQSSAIPRARTLGLFSNLSATFSRTSLSSFGRSGASRKPSSSSMADSNSNSASASKRSGSALGYGSSIAPSTREGTPFQGPSAPSVSARSTATTTPAPAPGGGGGDDVVEKKHHKNPNMVYEAHDFQFWIGRFMALQDRFKNEMLEPKNLDTIVAAHAQQSMLPPKPSSSKATTSKTGASAAGLPTSYTTANIARVSHLPTYTQSRPRPQQQTQMQTQGTAAATASGSGSGSSDTSPPLPPLPSRPRSPHSLLSDAALLLDDAARLRRTFRHMESICANNDSLGSMHRFQQAYARRFGLPDCLPSGGTMTDDDPRAQFFGVYPAYGDSQVDKGKGEAGAEGSGAGTEAGEGAGGSKVNGNGSGSGGGGGASMTEANDEASTKEANDEASIKEATKGDKDSKDDDESTGSIDGKGDKKKGKGWVGRMFSGGKKGGNTSPK